MIILAVHSTTPVQSLALTSGRGLLAERSRHCGRQHVEHLAPAIQDLVNVLERGLVSVDGLAVAVGPGSFSGIRVGIATVKGIALALGKPVVGISSLDALAWQGLRPDEVGAAVIDARRGELYVAAYRRGTDRLDMLSAPALVSVDEFASLRANRPGRFVVCGDPVVDTVAAVDSSLITRSIGSPSALACAELARARFEAGDSDRLHSLAPLYIRRSDAEEKPRTRRAASSSD